jgi:hypothetical protein
MRRHFPPDSPSKFAGNNRHYHRSGAGTQRTWDDWVEGRQVVKRNAGKWWKAAAVVVALLALAAIAAGLVIELL